ncbi:MAG: putative bacteriocin export ABC transporter [Sarcina ventriculi]
MNNICILKNIKKKFNNKYILNNFNLSIKKGEFVAIRGKSGAGKTTLLNIIGLLESYDDGELYLFENKISNLKYNSINKILRYKIGYLFQNYALIDDESIDKNLEIALMYSKKNKIDKLNAKINALNLVGLNLDLSKKIYELSGGEQQRVAIARLYLKPCELILADEPTGALDNSTKLEIIKLLKKLNKSGKTIIIVTHDNEVAQTCDRIIDL